LVRLVTEAMSRPATEREGYLRAAAPDEATFREALGLVEAAGGGPAREAARGRAEIAERAGDAAAAAAWRERA
jgi:hypothetical protein